MKAATSSSASPMTAAAWTWSASASKAIANGLATEAAIAAMSEQQILQFIFRAGFSTAEKVTSVSGRGVGMDVVRTNIERIGGTIEMTSVAGQGTTFLIKIPLTLAIVSALIVEAAGQRFAIPQLNVIELVGVSDRSEARIETINTSPVLRLRDRLLPLVSLRGVLGLETRRRQDRFVDRGPGRRQHLRHHRGPRVRHRGNRGQAGGADPARHALLCRQHHPGRRQRHHDPGPQRPFQCRRPARRQRPGGGARQGRRSDRRQRPGLVPAVPRRRPRTQGHSAGTGVAHRRPAMPPPSSMSAAAMWCSIAII